MSYLNVQFGKVAADSVADRGRRRVVIKVSRNGAAISWSNRIAAAADLAFDVRCLRLLFTILPFAKPAGRAWRHIPSHRSPRHAEGLDRDMAGRPQAPSRAHRSTSTA